MRPGFPAVGGDGESQVCPAAGGDARDLKSGHHSGTPRVSVGFYFGFMLALRIVKRIAADLNQGKLRVRRHDHQQRKRE